MSPPASLSAGLAPPPWPPEVPDLAAERVAMPPTRSNMGKSSAWLISVAATCARKGSDLLPCLPASLPACLPAHPPKHPTRTHLPKYLTN